MHSVEYRSSSIPYPGRRPGHRPGLFRPGFRQVPAGLRPACDFFGVETRKQLADRFELNRHVEVARTCLRQVGNQVCDLDSVMEFGLLRRPVEMNTCRLRENESL